MTQPTDTGESLCPSDGKPCTLKCYRGHPARPCDPVKPTKPQVAA